jgi:hypothetical protein
MDSYSAKRHFLSLGRIDEEVETPSAESRAQEDTTEKRNAWKIFAKKWGHAFKQVLPIYVAIRVACIVASALSVLFILGDFAPQSYGLNTIWHTWDHWDTGNFENIALHSYTVSTLTAFFPFYPILMRLIVPITHNILVAGLIISNLASMVMSVILYQLVYEDVGEEQANRAVLYLTLFPSAFFLVAAYNESLFICLTLLSFYNMRHGQWWFAGAYGLLASLTRSVGILLILPFCYEYLQQQNFRWQDIRLNSLSVLLIPTGLGIFGLYCYKHFGDFLMFSHVQSVWFRHFELPWYGIQESIRAILTSSGLLSFQGLHNTMQAGADLFIFGLLLLGLFGPWRFPRNQWSYLIYGFALYIFLNSVPVIGGATPPYTLKSMIRFLLEIFPAFIVLAKIGKFRFIHMNYVLVGGCIFFFLCIQFLTGHWIQ